MQFTITGSSPVVFIVRRASHTALQLVCPSLNATKLEDMSFYVSTQASTLASTLASTQSTTQACLEAAKRFIDELFRGIVDASDYRTLAQVINNLGWSSESISWSEVPTALDEDTLTLNIEVSIHEVPDAVAQA